MHDLIIALQLSRLFTGFSAKEIELLLEQTPHFIKHYQKNQLVALENEAFQSIGLVLKGSIEIKKSFVNGKTLAVTRFKTNDVFGEAMIFSQVNQYPSSIYAIQDTQIFFMHRTHVITICQKDEKFLHNFLAVLSGKLFILNNKITLLSCTSIRQKIALDLLQQYDKQGSLTLTLPFTREEWAENLAVPRPSLSRVLMQMKEKGILDYTRHTVRILQLEALAELLS